MILIGEVSKNVYGFAYVSADRDMDEYPLTPSDFESKYRWIDLKTALYWVVLARQKGIIEPSEYSVSIAKELADTISIEKFE